MDEQVLAVLEYHRVLDLVLRFAETAAGKRALKGARPSVDPEVVRALQEETSEVRAAFGPRGVPLGAIGDIETILARARADGLLAPEDLIRVAQTVRAAADLKKTLERAAVAGEPPAHGAPEAPPPPSALPRLFAIAARIPLVLEVAEAVEHALAVDGTVRSEASPTLLALRAEIARLQARIEHEIEKLLRDPEVLRSLRNPRPTLRNERYVLAVVADQRRKVPGVILDRSQTGVTVYVEPHAIVALGNDLADARSAERNEVTRILRELTRDVLARAPDLDAMGRALADLDFANARARWAEDSGFTEPLLAGLPDGAGALDLKAARHPLLLEQARMGRLPRGEVVPVDIRLGDAHDILIITGPNTGGKTVTLKTAGLLALLFQTGMHLPVAPRSALPVFRRVLADIGDEQSIEQSLSTFSSHVQRLVPILGEAGPRDLVLIDELGAGTDPSEGAALGVAIVERLLARKARALVTTHIGRLKDLAYRLPRIENAACEFDPKTLTPTFRLLVGQAGASHAFEVSRHLGLDEEVLARARALRGEEGRDLAVEAQEVASLRLDAGARLAEADRVREEAMASAAEAEAARDRLVARELSLEAEVDREMDERFRILECEIEAACERLAKAPLPFGEEARALLDRVRAILHRTPYGERRRAFAHRIKEGTSVYVIPLRRRGVVRKVNRSKERLSIDIGGMRADVAFRDVSWVEPPEPS